ncbi:hypothetical protein [Streptomyces sp. SS8]
MERATAEAVMPALNRIAREAHRHMELGNGLNLRAGRTYLPRQGETCSKVFSPGFAAEWTLEIPGRPDLTIHDTRWDNGERDVVLQQPPLLPEMPAALVNLHGRLRAGIEPGPSGRMRIMAYLALPSPNGRRPSLKKALTTAALVDGCGARALRMLIARPGVTLDPPFDLRKPQDKETFQHAIHFPEDDAETPVAAYVLTRTVPVLRHSGWLLESNS